MVISEIEYHLVLVFSINRTPTGKMKNDLSIIIPDIILELKGTQKRLKVHPDYLYLHFSSSADQSPIDLAKSIIRFASTRLIRLNKELQGYDLIFNENIYIKSGSRPKKSQIDDFMEISSSGL